MSKIYNTPDDVWQITVDDRLQGWQVQISFWDGDDFETRYDAYAICESLHEAITDAMATVGIDWELADFYAAEWGITPPESDE